MMDSGTGEMLTIGQVAKAAGTGVETVRFYEREHLLQTASRSASGYRLFGQEAVERLRFIARAKQLGFTLREIRDLFLLHLPEPDEEGLEEVCAAAEAKVDEIESKIHALKQIRRALLTLTEACRERRPTDGCPILASLHDDPTARQERRKPPRCSPQAGRKQPPTRKSQ